ncbi:hypothetical protein V3I01_11030 [Sphingomonas sp. gentR]|uniref:hypothetical protein n=1 Tax=unclassified Sphingomonas TaxID=196159 RepID=UPI0009726998|nr:hypothetical protein [Sphingomonas sp. LK11]APX66691.1 hypothetical protein AV944_13615 [Sphingomonas sp. LK11]
MTRFAALRRWTTRIACGGAVVVAGVLHVPAALAFPYRADFGRTTVLSEQPIDTAAMGQVLARADGLLAASPLYRPGLSRQLVLTDGGWRWDILSIGARGAIAFRRPFAHALIFNRHSVAADRVTNGAPLGGVRTLSGAIAHEMTHRLIADHIGEWAALRLPAWKREGYPDYVARETSIHPQDEALIRARDPHARVLTYYEGRRRVAAELARNGGSVDALLRD